MLRIRTSPTTTTAGLGVAAFRIILGGLMAGHGLQKLKGWFGGGGLDATASMFDHLGMRPGREHAIAAGATETTAGAMMALGAATPAASAGFTGLMGVAIAKVHGPNGPWVTKGGYEYNLALIAAAFALTEVGPGAFALDGSLLKRRAGLGYAVAQLAVGAAGAAAVVANARRSAQSDDSDDSAAS